MKYGNFMRGLRLIIPILMLLALSACGGPVNHPLWFLNPNGPIARASVYYLVVDVLLLLIVIVPATALVIWTFLRYRQGGKGGYDPTYNHSLTIEVIVWGVPFLIVVVLAYLVSYKGTRDVAPFDPQAVTAAVEKSGNKNPLHIQVISTDWQWLFIYPDQNIAMANRLVVPTGRRISMDLTSAGVTNDFYVLKAVNQIYIMPGMRTKMNFFMDRPGVYQGFSTAFSGPGFSWMNYKMLSVTPQQFQAWVQRAKSTPVRMDWQEFEKFAEPTINTGQQWALYSDVDEDLFKTLIKEIKTGQFKTKWPARLTEDMTSEEFKQKFGTGTAGKDTNSTTANQPQPFSDR